MLSKLRLFFLFPPLLFLSVREHPGGGAGASCAHTRSCALAAGGRLGRRSSPHAALPSTDGGAWRGAGRGGACGQAAALNALAAGLPSTSVCETRGVKLFTCGWPPAAVALNGPGRSSSSSTVNQLTALHPSIPWTRAAEPGFGGAGHVGRSAARAAG